MTCAVASLTSSRATSTAVAAPFSLQRLDELLADAGVDAVLATSPHNTRYMLGGYRFFLYGRNDAIGFSRYLPVVGYIVGQPDQSYYVGARNEAWGTEAASLWVAETAHASWGTVDAITAAADRLVDRGLGSARIGIEPAYLPADARAALGTTLPRAKFIDATEPLEELRAVKSERELELVRRGSEAVVDAMLATFSELRIGDSKNDAVERLRLEETRRGLTFAYGLVAAGADLGRGPGDQVLTPGSGLSLDSGADLVGYVADVARMAVVGTPVPRQIELLARVEEVQLAARAAVAEGRLGRQVVEAAERCAAGLPDAAAISFQAHGTGLLTHEAPRLMSNGAPPYSATHRNRALSAGMVLSIETHVVDSEVGFVKLEDTVIVTRHGYEVPGDRGRGWNRIGDGARIARRGDGAVGAGA